MSRKVLQIRYEPERDRLTWDGWDIHCGQCLDVLLPDRFGGGVWKEVSFEYNDNGWYIVLLRNAWIGSAEIGSRNYIKMGGSYDSSGRLLPGFY